MSKKRMIVSIVVFAVLILGLLAGVFLLPKSGSEEEIGEVMKDAVLHESVKVSLFGIRDVNPGLIAAYVVTAIITLFCLVVRIFFVPKFKRVPGKFQMLIEMAVGLFDKTAETNSPHKNKFLKAYMFIAGAYIFVGTLFELVGFQVTATNGHQVALAAPLCDINGAIAMGCTTYGFLLVSGLVSNGFKGFLKILKDFSLPISMSLRLFGALLSGGLVTELVYYYTITSYGIPVIVGVLFTLLHALIQAYVLTMLVSVFYGEATEPSEKKEKVKKSKKNNINDSDIVAEV